MEKLADYIRWIGDLDFRVYPLRDADAVILANISYFDLTPVFSDEKPEHTVADCLPMIEAGEAKLMITGGDLGNRELFAAAARSAHVSAAAVLRCNLSRAGFFGDRIPRNGRLHRGMA